MAVTVRRLAQHPELGLSLIAGRENADRTIAWAHAIELADPTPYLSGGELVMTTGMNIGATDSEQFAYLTRLSAAGVAALAFDTGTTFTRVPGGIIAAGDALGMPVLAVPAHIPFIAITRAVIDEVTADQLRSVQRVVDRQQAMARDLLKNGIPAVVSALSTSLSAAVIVLATDGSTLAASGADTGRISELCSEQIQSTRTRTNRNQASQVLADGDAYCTLQVLRASHPLRGYLAVRSEEPLSPLDKLLVAHAVSLISIEMDKPAKVLDAEHRLRAAVTQALLTKPTTIDAGLLRYFGFDPEQLATVAVLTNTGPALAAEKHAQRVLDAIATPYLMRSHADQIELVLPVDAVASVDTIRKALGAQLQRRLGGGVSRPGAFDSLALCLSQAQAAAHTHLDQDRVCEFAELGVFSILLGNRSVADLELMAQQLRPLDDHDGNSTTAGLVATLEAYLRNNGHVESAAAAIGIHRHTMRNRLAKIRELTNCNLETADSRAEMWLAIKARELLRISASETTPPQHM
jgi:PucR family transcriptional regulator, purine catabolism regulatory protein